MEFKLALVGIVTRNRQRVVEDSHTRRRERYQHGEAVVSTKVVREGNPKNLDLENGAWSLTIGIAGGPGLKAYAATVAFDDFLGDDQTQSGLRVIAKCDEGLEDPGPLIERYAGTGIRHR